MRKVAGCRSRQSGKHAQPVPAVGGQLVPMAAELQAGVDDGHETLIRDIRLSELRREPLRHVEPAPKPVPAVRIGDRSGEPPLRSVTLYKVRRASLSAADFTF